MKVSFQYLAGLFDGEGSIGIYPHHRGRMSLRTQLVQNKNKNTFPLLQYLSKRYGGTLPPQKSVSGKWKVNWQLSSERALLFLRDIYPYLVIKREQAAIAIAWQQSRPKAFRDSEGHFASYPDHAKDRRVAKQLKRMKKIR